MTKKRNTILEILIQFILIVFSVVLGIYLSERIEEGKKRKESEELLAKIKSEVKDNIQLLEKWAPYHQKIYKNLDSLSKDSAFVAEFIKDKYVFFERLLSEGTFMARSPVNDAWDIAKSHPLIVNIDYDKLLILSRVYNQQALTFEPMFELFDLFNSKDVNLEKDAQTNLKLIRDRIWDLVARERQLMGFYRQAEEILDLNDEGKGDD